MFETLISFAKANPELVVSGALALGGAIGAIAVKLTPTEVDDEWWERYVVPNRERIAGWLRKLLGRR